VFFKTYRHRDFVDVDFVAVDDDEPFDDVVLDDEDDGAAVFDDHADYNAFYHLLLMNLFRDSLMFRFDYLCLMKMNEQYYHAYHCNDEFSKDEHFELLAMFVLSNLKIILLSEIK